MLTTIPLWLHIVAATIWVGSQVMMFVVVVPSLRAASDPGARHAVLSGVTRRFAYLGYASLALLVLTGIDNVDRYAPSPIFDFRYGYILAVKLTLLAVVLALTVLHTAYVGPRLLALQGTAAATDERPVRLGSFRAWSVLISSLTLLLSLAILFCAALLRSRYAYG